MDESGELFETRLTEGTTLNRTSSTIQCQHDHKEIAAMTNLKKCAVLVVVLGERRAWLHAERKHEMA
jgi:hypothetical protein